MMKNKTRVMIYEPYPFNEVAGNLRTLQYILKFLNKDEFEVMVVAPFNNKFKDRINEIGVTCDIVAPPERLQRYGGQSLNDGIVGKFWSVIALIKYGHKIRRYLKSNKIDVVYCNGIRSVMTVGIVAYLCRIPFLWYVKGQLEHRFYDMLAYLTASKILFYSEINSVDCYPRVRQFFSKKVEILRTGIDLNEVKSIQTTNNSYLKKELAIVDNCVNIAYVGQLYEPKGVHYLLEAFTKASLLNNNLRLFIIGSPIIDEYADYLNTLKMIISDNSIGDKVTFTGWRDDAMNIISLMDVIVHPSLAEGFSRSVLESMALGKAVIATGVGGERETIVNDKNGYLVKPKRADLICNHILKLSSDLPLMKKIGNEARKTIISMHNIADKVVRLGVIFQELKEIR